MNVNRRLIGTSRRGLGVVENALIDDLLAGRVDRRTFLRHGSVLGIGLPVLGGLAYATVPPGTITF